MTALTRTGITNLALRDLGGTRIEDWEEGSFEAIVARDVWDQAVRQALGRHGWQFAMRGVSLARQVDVPETRYAYRYTLPGDFVRLDAASASDTMDPPLDDDGGFAIRDGVFETSAEQVFLEYVYDAPVIGVWPPWFVGVVSADLASFMAGSLKSTREREGLEALADKRLREGLSTDSIQQMTQRRPAGSWRRAARGGWRG